MSSAAMNNNPQGVQQVMQPVAAPSMNSLAVSSPSRGGLLNMGTPPMPNGNDAFQPMTDQSMPSRSSLINLGQSHSPNAVGVATARASDLRQQTSDSKWRMAQSAATPLAPTPSNPFFRPQGRDPQNPSSFAPQNVHPGGGNFVDQGGQIQPRQGTSMARNVMAGQAAEGSPSFGQPMNIPGATQTLGGNVVSPPQRYGQEGVIPGAFRGMTPAEGDMHGMSPDAFRVATGGQPMVPYVPSGVPATDGRTARQTTIANRNARARGVRGSDVAEWRATSPSALIPQMNREQQQQVATDQAAPTGRNDNYSEWGGQADPANQAQAPVSPVTQAPVNPFAQAASPSATPSQPGTVGVMGLSADPSIRRGQLWRGATNNWLARRMAGFADMAGSPHSPH